MVRQAFAYLRGWHIVLLALLALVPLLMLFSFIDYSQFSVVTYARLGLLKQAGLNSLIHLVLTLVGCSIIGVILAWVTSVCRFPAMESFWWVWLLPMALPTFTVAAIYEQMGTFAMLDTAYRMAIYSTLSLYPLVYLIMRIAFSSQNREYLDGSRCLGTGVFSGVFRVGLFMNRPAFVAALLLVAMEVLSDLATPGLLGFQSIANVTFQAVQDEQVRPLAIELTTLVLCILLALLWFDGFSRGNRQYHQIISGFRRSERVDISRYATACCVIFSVIVLTVSLLLPLMVLVTVSPDHAQSSLSELWLPASVSFGLAGITGLVVVSIGSIIGFDLRYHPSVVMRFVGLLPALSLVVPGSILALLVVTPVQLADDLLARILSLIYQQPVVSPLTSTIIPAVYLLSIKFLAIGAFAIRATIELTSETMDQASRSLGRNTLTTFFRIHIPYLLPTLFAVFFLVFVEVLRESAIVLILMPAEHQTLINHIFASIRSDGILASSREVVLLLSLALVPALILTAIINLKKT